MDQGDWSKHDFYYNICRSENLHFIDSAKKCNVSTKRSYLKNLTNVQKIGLLSTHLYRGFISKHLRRLPRTIPVLEDQILDFEWKVPPSPYAHFSIVNTEEDKPQCGSFKPPLHWGKVCVYRRCCCRCAIILHR